MKPIVNLEENVGKTVGEIPQLTVAEALDLLTRRFQSLGLSLPYPKGVYRFKTFEEADAWEQNHMMAAAKKKLRARRSQQT